MAVNALKLETATPSWLVSPFGSDTVGSIVAATDVVSWQGNLTIGAGEYVLVIESTTDVLSWDEGPNA